jgi:hypothetical protein
VPCPETHTRYRPDGVTGAAALETSITAAMVEKDTSFVMGLSLFALVLCNVG